MKKIKILIVLFLVTISNKKIPKKNTIDKTRKTYVDYVLSNNKGISHHHLWRNYNGQLDKNGDYKDIVLGYNTLAEYEAENKMAIREGNSNQEYNGSKQWSQSYPWWS